MHARDSKVIRIFQGVFTISKRPLSWEELHFLGWMIGSMGEVLQNCVVRFEPQFWTKS